MENNNSSSQREVKGGKPHIEAVEERRGRHFCRHGSAHIYLNLYAALRCHELSTAARLALGKCEGEQEKAFGTSSTRALASHQFSIIALRQVGVDLVAPPEPSGAAFKIGGAMALPESDDRSSVSRRLDSCRLPGSDRSPIGTWQDRVPHVPPHLPRVAGRNRSTRGGTAETHATRARFHHDGSIRQCLGPSQAQGQSADRATTVEKVCQPTGLHSINKGNCEAVPLIGQFWTVATTAQLPVTP